MRVRLRPLLAAVPAAALAACGGGHATPAQHAASCLDGRGFLVQAWGARVEGTSPGGVGFSVAVPGGRIDDAGNPGGRRLGAGARAAVRACVPRR